MNRPTDALTARIKRIARITRVHLAASILSVLFASPPPPPPPPPHPPTPPPPPPPQRHHPQAAHLHHRLPQRPPIRRHQPLQLPLAGDDLGDPRQEPDPAGEGRVGRPRRSAARRIPPQGVAPESHGGGPSRAGEALRRSRLQGRDVA